jgi:predicted ribosomally synthesized peptide with nif11-like leader
MSLENAVKFVQKLNEDQAMADSLKGMSSDQVLALASSHDLDFTMGEFEEVCEYSANLGEEIDIEELEKVVGGIAPLVVFGAISAAAAVGGFAYKVGKGEGWW